eukprot:11482197-Alexandrium_andersonii.AAC.1
MNFLNSATSACETLGAEERAHNTHRPWKSQCATRNHQTASMGCVRTPTEGVKPPSSPHSTIASQKRSKHNENKSQSQYRGSDFLLRLRRRG